MEIKVRPTAACAVNMFIEMSTGNAGATKGWQEQGGGWRTLKCPAIFRNICV